MNPDGTRQRYCVYARTREECERKLEEIIEKLMEEKKLKYCKHRNKAEHQKATTDRDFIKN